MSEQRIADAKRLRDRAKSERKRGDAYKRFGHTQQSVQAFEEGVGLLKESIELLKEGAQEDAAFDLAESYGSLGGLLRRVGSERLGEALEAYMAGAEIEASHKLPSTYNRLNAIKLRLQLGESSLAGASDEINDLAKMIDRSIGIDPEMRESGWAYADLGDCYALLGNLDEATTAYETFIRKAESRSPETTLNVLAELVEALQAHGDEHAYRLAAARDMLLERLKKS